MKELATKLIKKVTLEVIYEAVEERTGEIKNDIAELKAKQEQDFRYLNDKIDTLGRELRQDMGQVNQRIDALSQKVDTQIGQTNQRLDTVIQMLMELSKQVVELSKQKS